MMIFGEGDQDRTITVTTVSESDYDDLFEFLSQLKDDEFEGYPGITYENGKEYLRQRLDSEEFYAVALLDSGKVIGNIYCGNRDYDAKEVGYIINRNCRRMGYAKEALSAVIGNAFRDGAHRVFAECDPRNTASWKLLEKVGLQREDRTSGFIRTEMAIPSGRTPTCTRNIILP